MVGVPAYYNPKWVPRNPREWRGFREELEGYIDPNANDFIMNIRNDLRAHWDRIIIFTGKRGVGKSTLDMLISKLIDYTFHFGRMAFEPEDIIPIFFQMNKYEAMDLDEGGESWNRADWATRVSKTITKQFIGDRYLFSYRGICAPTIFHLNKSAIDLADYWIKVWSPDNRTRGFAEIRMMSEKDFIDKKLPFAPPIYDLKFSDLPTYVAQEYERFKTRRGIKRSEKYARTIGEETEQVEAMPMLDLEEVAREVVARKEKFIGTRGRFSWHLIYMQYKPKGLGQEKAETIAQYLNKGLSEANPT